MLVHTEVMTDRKTLSKTHPTSVLTCRLTRYRDRQFRLQNSWYLLLESSRSIMSKLSRCEPHHEQGVTLRWLKRNLVTQLSEQNRFCTPSNCTTCGEDSREVHSVPQKSQALMSSLLAYWNAERQGSLHRLLRMPLYFTACLITSF